MQLLQHEKQCHKLNNIHSNENILEGTDNLKQCNGILKNYMCVFCKQLFTNKDEWKKHQSDAHADLLSK